MAGKKGPTTRKRVDSDARTMKRAPDGSGYLTCDSCKATVPIAVADMHDCADDAARKAKLARNREESKQNHQVEKEIKAKEKKTISKTSKKADKDPNQPKKPSTAYMIFLEGFRKQYKEEHPDSKGVTEVTKAAGVKWKSLTEEEKKPFIEEQAKRKADYEKVLADYKDQAETIDSTVTGETEGTADETTQTQKRRRLAEKPQADDEEVQNDLEDEE